MSRNKPSTSLLDHRYAGIDGPGFRQTPGGVRRNPNMNGCTSGSCYGAEGGQGVGPTPLPKQGAAQAMLAYRYGKGQ